MADNLKLIFCVFIIMSVYLAHVYIARSEKNKYSKILSEITLAGTLSAISYCLFMLFRSYLLAFLSITLYCLALDWMVYFVFVYILILTEAGPKLIVWRKPVRLLIVLDSLDLLANIFIHHKFDLVPSAADTTIKHFSGMGTPWYAVSNFLSYAIAFMALCILIQKTLDANLFVRKKYLRVLGGYSFVLLINLLCVIFRTDIDYSILFYFLGAILLWYGTAEAFPKQMMKDANDVLIQSDRRMILYFDYEGHCLFANKQAELFFDMNQHTGFQNAETVCAPLRKLLDEQSLTDEEWEDKPHTQTLNVAGQDKYIHYYIWYMKDLKNRNAGYCLAMEDRTKEREEQILAKYRDFHDDLTGVLNRTGFLHEGKTFLEENAGENYRLVSVNIRNFKLINNLFGSEVGDRILINLANAIENNVSLTKSGSDESFSLPVGRMGGDRFAFLMSEDMNEKQTINEITSDILKVYEKYHYRMELIFGICPVDDLTESVHSFYNKATLASQSVDTGLSQNYAYYDADLMQEIVHEKALVDSFDDALKNNQFSIYIQPQYDVHEKIKGGEALVRWIHPENGLIEPMSFIEVFERTGCIHKLDLFVWEEAVKTLKKWQDRGLADYYLAVNISVIDFFYLDVYEEITRLTDRYGIDRKRLKLEITETVMMNDADRVLDVLNKLRDAGYTIEVDDFGSGFSSLNRLKDIPAEGLKMDLGFLSATKNRQRRSAITDSIIYLGKRLHMTVIAEGVETKEQYEDLAGVGCEIFQGYFFSKPVPLPVFETLMTKS